MDISAVYKLPGNFITLFSSFGNHHPLKPFQMNTWFFQSMKIHLYFLAIGFVIVKCFLLFQSQSKRINYITFYIFWTWTSKNLPCMAIVDQINILPHQFFPKMRRELITQRPYLSLLGYENNICLVSFCRGREVEIWNDFTQGFPL